MFLPFADPTGSDDLSWLGLVVPGIATTIVGIAGAVSLVWRRKQDRDDQKADKAAEIEAEAIPKVVDGWQEVRQARAEATRYYLLYRTFEDLFYRVQSALRRLVRSIRSAHPEQEFDDEVAEALALKPPETA